MANAKKSNTGLYVGIVVVIIIVAIIVGVVVANNNKGDEGGSSDNGGGTSQTTEATLTEDDLLDVDDFVDIDEYDKMESVAKAIQNGELTGKVMQFDGYAAHPGTSYSVVLESPDGTEKIGTVFRIVDGDESDYPEDGARIFLTGKIVEEQPMVYTIHTLKSAIREL